MKKAIVVIFALVLPCLALAGDPAKGKDIYAGKCLMCHGEKGDGNGPAGKALRPKPTDFTDSQGMSGKTDAGLTKVIKEGGAAVGKSPIMAAFGSQLKDDEVTDLVAYVRTFSKR